MANQIIYEVCGVLERYLSTYFGKFSAKVIDCPDLCRRPFYLSRSGISGDSTIAALGSLDHLLPAADPNRLYDLMHTAKASRQDYGMIIGGGLGPFQTYKRPCEVAADITFTARGLETNNSLVGFADKKEAAPELYPASNSYIASLGQFFLTEGKPGKVIEIQAQNRGCNRGIFDLMQTALCQKYGHEKLPIGLGCVFCLQNSSAQVSLLNEVPSDPNYNIKSIKRYKTLFSIDGPIIGAGTIISHDPTRLGYMMRSFYCWNTARTLMGEFEKENDPVNGYYRIYLAVAKQIYRHDRPIYGL